MYETLLGRDGFRKGMDLYFKRHDGQAVTCEDFFAAMRDANGEDIGALFTWYSQAGTPTLTVRVSHDAAAGTLTLVCEQALPATPDAGGDGTKAPQLIPLRVGLLGADGADLPLQLAGEAAAAGGALPTCVVLRCGAPSCTFTFTGLPRGAPPPVPSLLRGYSAPVHLKVVPEPTEEALTFQLAHDSDAFARFEAAQTLGARAVMRAHAAGGAAPSAGDPAWASLCAAFRAVLEAGTAQKLDRVFVAEALSLPGVSELIEAAAPVDPVALWAAREAVVRALAAALEPQLLAAFRAAEAEAEAAGPAAADAYSAAGVERRALRNLALALLAKLGGEHTALVSSAYERARNMTDAAAALRALAATPGAARDAALAHFYGKWRTDPLVLVKWFGIQAASNAPGAVAAVAALTAHPDFDWRNPNKVYATLCGFARASYAGFHAADGSGYALLADAVLKLDAQNPQVAARVADAFTQWRKYDAGRQAAMRAQLERIVAHPGLSANVREIAGKSLK
jgi:aminopeptidase N